MDGAKSEEQKTAVIKALAIVGFIVALIFVAWLAVQAVRMVPVAFNTLASIANGLRDTAEEPDFALTTDTTLINTGETLTISWTEPGTDGTYTFSYHCTDGVVAEMSENTGTLSTFVCDTDTSVTAENNTVAVIFSSEKSRFVDVPYTVGFMADGADATAKSEGVITIVNPGIDADGVATQTDTPADETGTTPLEDIPNTGITEEPETPVVDSEPNAPSGGGYTTVPVVVTTMPVSNPNGSIDLAVSFIAVGTYDTGGQKFIARSALDEDERGAVQFEVKNIGTKTSGVWYFSAQLPTDPIFTYRSSENAALKPNERQVVTLQFDNVSRDSGKRIIVTVTGTNETTTANNSFSKSVEVLD